MPIDFSSPVNNIINIFQSKSCLSTALNRDIDELTTWMNKFIKLDLKETPLVENLDLTEYKKYPWFEKTLEDLLNSRTNDLQFSSPAIEAYILDETKNPRDYFSSQADALFFKHLLDTIAIAALIRLDQEDNLTLVAARELSHHIAAEVDGDGAEWVSTPKGLCEKLVGGSLSPKMEGGETPVPMKNGCDGKHGCPAAAEDKS